MPSLIGNKPNQVPSNGDLGTLAFQDSNAVNISGGIVEVSAGTAALPTLGTTGDPNTGVFFPAADTVAVATNGVEAVRVDANGNLGVGVTPSARLSVRTTGAQVDVSSTASSVTFEAIDRSAPTNPVNTLYYSRNGTFQWYNSSYSERMRIDANGNVGVGATNPAVKLQVQGANVASPTLGSASGALALTGVAGSYGLYAGVSSNGDTWIQSQRNDANTTTYNINLNPSGGNIGIGTNNAGYRLHVVGATQLNHQYSLAVNGLNWGQFNVGGDASINNTANANLLIATNNTERMRIDASGNLLVGTTSATSGGAKLQTADGITFPATQVASANANTLDDYEEGTWTPVLVGGGTAGTGTYTAQVGTYTKVGRLITVTCSVVWTAHTGAGSMSITGLPFSSGNLNANAEYLSTAEFGTMTMPALTTPIILLVNNSSKFDIYSQAVGTGSLTGLNMDAAASIYFSITYQTA